MSVTDEALVAILKSKFIDLLEEASWINRFRKARRSAILMMYACVALHILCTIEISALSFWKVGKFWQIGNLDKICWRGLVKALRGTTMGFGLASYIISS